MKNILITFLFTAITFFGMFYTIKTYLDMPDVVFSYSTKECVRVEYADGTLGSCDNLPSKFNHIWGK